METIAIVAGVCFLGLLLSWKYEGRKAKPIQGIPFEALVAPAGSTVILRSSDSLSEAQREKVREFLARLGAERGVKFVMFEGDWQACVIGAAE